MYYNQYYCCLFDNIKMEKEDELDLILTRFPDLIEKILDIYYLLKKRNQKGTMQYTLEAIPLSEEHIRNYLFSRFQYYQNEIASKLVNLRVFSIFIRSSKKILYISKYQIGVFEFGFGGTMEHKKLIDLSRFDDMTIDAIIRLLNNEIQLSQNFSEINLDAVRWWTVCQMCRILLKDSNFYANYKNKIFLNQKNEQLLQMEENLKNKEMEIKEREIKLKENEIKLKEKEKEIQFREKNIENRESAEEKNAKIFAMYEKDYNTFIYNRNKFMKEVYKYNMVNTSNPFIWKDLALSSRDYDNRKKRKNREKENREKENIEE